MTDLASIPAREGSRAAHLGDSGECMADNMQRPGIEACGWATVPEVGNGAEEMQRQFALWYESETARWERAAHRYLRDFPLLIEDAVQEGWIKGGRQLQKQESKVAGLWSDSQNGNDKALDQLRGYMFRVVAGAAFDLLEKELETEPQDEERLTSDHRASGHDNPWNDLDQKLPEISHWDDAESTIRALLVVHGIGASFEARTQTFLGSFANGEEFLAGFRVCLGRSKRRNMLEWVQIVNALAAGLRPAEIKILIWGVRLTEKKAQELWGRRRKTLHDNFDRWRRDWLELNKDKP
jgi:DNA-directed RNA polymerase specialized sigma24 family protein